jgi:electron transfer flavoprotein alpha subunit
VVALTEEWRDLLVFGEPRGTSPSQASFEALGKARDLADRLGARVLSAWPGEEEAGQDLVHRGADELLVLEGQATPRALKATLEGLVRERRPELLLFAATPLGQELAGRLAASLGVGAMANCLDLDLYEAARLFVGKRTAHGGAVVEQVTVPRARPQIATLRPGAVRAPWPDDSRSARVTRVPMAVAAQGGPKVQGRAPKKPPQAWRGAERLVVGGALLGAEEFDTLRLVADKLGAAWAATRPAAALGLAPEDRALRPWDRYPAPRLCIAAGIEDPFEFSLALPQPRQLVLLGEGPLEKVASHVVPGDPGAALRALAEQVR